MKKHFKTILLLSILLLICILASSFAYISYANYQEKQTLSEELTSKANSIVNILNQDKSEISTYSLNNETYDYVERNVSNKFENSHYYSVNTEDYTINLDYSTKELKSVLSKTNPVVASSVSKDSVLSTVENIYSNLNLPDDYLLASISQYSDTIWQVIFAKKYGDTFNKYESVKIFFYPAENKIFSINVFDETVPEVAAVASVQNYSEDDYIQKAVSEVNLNVNNIHSTGISFEKANNYYNSNSTDTSIHKVFVINENLENYTRVIYVDINTCEIIGGDHYLCLLED